MSWRSVGSGRYYQSSYRDHNGRVRSRYLGRGPLAEAAASLDALERGRRIDRTERTRAERSRIAVLEGPVLEYSQSVDRLFAAWMPLHGWYKHRGQWRKRGPITRRVLMSKGSDDVEAASRAEESGRLRAEGDFEALMRRYRADTAQNAMDMLISEITDDPFRRECLRRNAVRLQKELAGDHPSPIERILAERVAVCYLDTYYSDMLAISNSNLVHGDITQRRQDRAQRRYLQAIRALAECRKIEASTIQDKVRRFNVVG
jgi:hypothetical protein